MDASFWHQKWADNNIAFHNRESHPLLVKHFDALSLAEGSRIFLPLCGKTLDIAWLLSRGYCVAGAELSKIAVDQLFAALGCDFTLVQRGKITHYIAENIDIFAGDIFQLSGNVLGSVDAIYDRAALVALPREMRDRYTAHLVEITNAAPQLLICYEYDQTLMAGPPHAISHKEVAEHYQNSYRLKLVESKEVPNGLKGKCPATENVWLLGNNRTVANQQHRK
ncbi:MAG: thiopurine S-methyltransferase [Cyanobacteria bacterium P01_D01_bin.105]